jgi:hypothetical protein
MARDLTVAQLERMLERKRSRLEKLIVQRGKLRRQLAQVEVQIAAIEGAVRKGVKSRRVRKRPKNTRTLLQAVTDVLSENKKGLRLKELAARIVSSGYKTASTNFENTVYQIIYNNQEKVAHDPKTRTYRLKGSS